MCPEKETIRPCPVRLRTESGNVNVTCIDFVIRRGGVGVNREYDKSRDEFTLESLQKVLME